MSWEVDFRNDFDATASCVTYDFLQIFLGVILARHFREVIIIGTFLSKAWVFVHGHAPSLVVGEVQVQGVELKEIHLVDAFFQLVYCPEVTATVEHQTTITIKWLVLDVEYREFTVLGGKDELVKTGKRMADTCYITCFQLDDILGDSQLIGFFG